MATWLVASLGRDATASDPLSRQGDAEAERSLANDERYLEDIGLSDEKPIALKRDVAVGCSVQFEGADQRQLESPTRTDRGPWPRNGPIAG
jgi:hypothetical protein